MKALHTEVFLILSITALLFISGCAKTQTEEIPPNEGTKGLIGADVSKTHEPLENLQNFNNANIRLFGADKLFWNDFEPSELSGYQWDDYDTAIKRVEAISGDVSPTIWSVSSWATKVPSPEKPGSPPKPEFDLRYSDFIKAFMERYDHDGIDDMPGLLSEHRYLQIEDEAENIGDAWTSSSDCDIYVQNTPEFYRCAANEYGEMLKLAYQAAHEANPNAQIISFSFNPGDYFDNNPANPSPSGVKFAFLDEVFTKYSNDFDIIGLQCNYDYPGIVPWFEFIRNRYNLNKPMICADAASIPLLGLHQFQPADQYENKYPFMTDSEILQILVEGSGNPRYDEIKEWWEAKKAKLSVKKAVMAADAGAEQIFFQYIMTRTLSTDPWDHSNLLSPGPEAGRPEPKGTPMPVVYALGQLNEKVKNFKSIQNLHPISPGQDPYDWLWLYSFDAGTRYILWNEAGDTADLSSYVSTVDVRVTHLVTELDSNYDPIYPSDEIVPADSIQVDETPIFVEALLN